MLRKIVADECALSVQRRRAAKMLSTNSYMDWLSAQNNPLPPVPYVINRDPCPKCGVRGDVGCSHREASQPEQAPEYRAHNPEHHRMKAPTWECGHPQTETNTRHDGRCAQCRRKVERDASRRYRQRGAR